MSLPPPDPGFAAELRDRIYDLVLPIRPWAVKRTTAVPILQPDKLPSLSVFVISEDGGPDGDANSGPIRFEVETTIGISVMRGFKRTGILEGDLDADDDAIRQRLFTNAEFTRHGPGALFEAITRLRSSRAYPKDGETYFAELRLEITFMRRAEYRPVLTDDYARTVLRTRLAGSGPNTVAVETVIDAAQD